MIQDPIDGWVERMHEEMDNQSTLFALLNSLRFKYVTALFS